MAYSAAMDFPQFILDGSGTRILIGLMAGPVATGALTDYVFHDHEAVGYSAAIVCAASVLIAALAFIGLLKPFRAAALAEAS